MIKTEACHCILMSMHSKDDLILAKVPELKHVVDSASYDLKDRRKLCIDEQIATSGFHVVILTKLSVLRMRL